MLFVFVSLFGKWFTLEYVTKPEIPLKLEKGKCREVWEEGKRRTCPGEVIAVKAPGL